MQKNIRILWQPDQPQQNELRFQTAISKNGQQTNLNNDILNDQIIHPTNQITDSTIRSYMKQFKYCNRFVQQTKFQTKESRKTNLIACMYKMHEKKNVARELSFFTSTTRSRRILLKIFELLQDPLGSHSDSCNSKFHRSITHSTDKLMEFCLTNTTKTLMKLMNKT